MSTKLLKKRSILLSILILLTIVFVILICMIFSTGKFTLREVKSTDVIHKLKTIQDKGGDFKLNQKDIDEVTSLFFAKPKTKGDLTVKGVNVDLSNNELLISLPVSYKSLNLLLSSKGKLNFINGQVVYNPDYFKIGKLSLPQNIVFSQASKFNIDKFNLKDNVIKINPNVFPFKITSLKIDDNEILGKSEKFDAKKLFQNVDKKNIQDVDKKLYDIEAKINSASLIMEKKDKEKISKVSKIIEGAKNQSLEKKIKVIDKAISEIDKAIDTVDKKQKEKLNSIKTEIKEVKKEADEKEKIKSEQVKSKRDALERIKGGLSGAYGSVQTSKENQIISIMIATVDQMIANPSYDAGGNQAEVKAIYSSLDAKSRERVKGAIFSNVSGDNIGQLREAFGM